MSKFITRALVLLAIGAIALLYWALILLGLKGWDLPMTGQAFAFTLLLLSPGFMALGLIFPLLRDWDWADRMEVRSPSRSPKTSKSTPLPIWQETRVL